MIKGAIFDADGTLLDSMSIWNDAGARYLNRCFGIRAGLELANAMFCMSLDEGASYMKTTYALPASANEIKQGVLETIRQFYEEEVQPKPGAGAFLQALYDRHIPMMIATSSNRQHIIAAMERLNYLRFFTGILTCEEAGAGKRRPDVYLRCALQLGLMPCEICVFEDALYAVRTAGKAGFYTAGVADEASIADEPLMKKECSIYLRDLTNIKDFCLWAKL